MSKNKYNCENYKDTGVISLGNNIKGFKKCPYCDKKMKTQLLKLNNGSDKICSNYHKNT